MGLSRLLRIKDKKIPLGNECRCGLLIIFENLGRQALFRKLLKRQYRIMSAKTKSIR
jgi:hypothetical protein